MPAGRHCHGNSPVNRGKAFQQLAALLDRLSREAACQHLRPPAIEHGSEDPFLSPEQPNVRIHQHPRDATRNGTPHNDP